MSISAKVVILAGGQGSRFWPMSRSKKPKQFLSLGSSGKSLIRATADRVATLVSEENVWVVSNEQLKPLIAEHVPWAHVLCEPCARNTAPSIGLAAIELVSKDPKAVMIVLPADHSVANEDALNEVLREAVQIASTQDVLVTVGITPTQPNTGYGYIKRGGLLSGKAFRVNRFFEKPSLERAIKYLESGDFYWNSGMFVWRASEILRAIRDNLPDLYRVLEEYQLLSVQGKNEEAQAVFAKAESISIDFGVLEHAKNGVVIEAGNIGWSDVGSWDQWAAEFKHDKRGNHIQGDAVVIDSENCVVNAVHRMIAVVGGQDLVVVDSGDALLVCPRGRVQDVRKVVEELKARGRSELI
jgi:mannose-1-phosphate guanylyltransferase